MTRKELQKMIALHESRAQWARSRIANHNHEFFDEDLDQWLDELSKELKILEWLRNQKPDDE
jgi:hypothetical protein